MKDDNNIIRLDNLYRSKNLKKSSNKNKKMTKDNTKKNNIPQTKTRTQNLRTNKSPNINKEEFDYKTYFYEKVQQEYIPDKLEDIKLEKDGCYSNDSENRKKRVSSQRNNTTKQDITRKKTSSKNKRNTKRSKRKKKKRHVKLIFKILFSIIILIIMLALLMYFLMTSNFFNIKEVTVAGQLKEYTSEQIIEKSNIQMDQNLFKTRFITSTNKIKELPYIDTAKLQVKLPNKIEIKVTERVPYIILQLHDDIKLVIDKDNHLLFIGSQIDKEKIDVPTILNSDISGEYSISNLGNVVKYKGDYIMPNVKILLDGFNTANMLKDISSIEYNIENIVIVLKNNTKINFGKIENMTYKINITKKIIEETKNQEGIIDLNKTNPTFVPKVFS